MTVAEANAVLDSIALKDRVSWEQARYISYIQAITQGAKLKSPLDLIKFSWEITEADNAEVTDTRTKEEIVQSLLDIKNSLK